MPIPTGCSGNNNSASVDTSPTTRISPWSATPAPNHHFARKIMTQIFGWHGIHLDDATSEQLRGAIFEGPCASPPNGGNTPETTLWCDARQCASQDGLHAVLAGEPRWKSGELATCAREQGAARALLLAYRKHGRQLFAQLAGPFSFALLDQARDRLLLAVDRVGVHALYYARTGHGQEVVFGSSLNSLCRHPRVAATLAPQAIFDYLFFHMVPSPGTIYDNIRKLLPAQYVEISPRGIEQGIYWNPEFTDQRQASFGSLAGQLRAQLEESIARQPLGQGCGAFLSGGVDSSTVVGLMNQRQEAPVEAFSIGFDARGYDEIGFARSTARHYGARLHEYYVTPDDIIDLVPRIARAYDEPFGNSSVIPTYYCAHLAREHGIHTMLAGDGGDELFAGNARYAKQKVFEAYAVLPGALRRNILEPLAEHFPLRDRIMPLRKLHSYIEQANIPLPRRLESYNFMERIDLQQVLDDEFLAAIDPQHPHALMAETYARARATSCVDKMLYHDWKFTLADNDLRKVNRMCALAGVTVAYPLLDEDLVEFSTRVPASLKLSGLRLRYFFKQAMKDFLPPHTMRKSKHGFGLPFGVWLKSSPSLQTFTYDALLAMKRRHIFKDRFIDDLISSHKSGHAAFYGDMIWVTMILEHWLASHHQ